MLREIPKVKQVEGEPPRRWFSDPRFDLHVWMQSGVVGGFELSYDKGVNERSLRWHDGVLQHRGIDDGECRGMRQKASPMVVADGVLDPIPVLVEFLLHALEMDQQIARQVVAVLLEQGVATERLPEAVLMDALDSLNQAEEDWRIAGRCLQKSFQFRDFRQAFQFMGQVALVAELLDHHPDWSNHYSLVNIQLTTHKRGGLTRLDILLASVMQALADKLHAQIA